MNDTRSTTATIADDQQPSLAVIDLVARVERTDPVELEPLYDAVDPDVLDTICDPDSGFSRLEFTYHGYSVAVEAANGELSVSLADGAVSADETAVLDGEFST